VARTGTELDGLVREIGEKFAGVKAVGIVADLVVGLFSSFLFKLGNFDFVNSFVFGIGIGLGSGCWSFGRRIIC